MDTTKGYIAMCEAAEEIQDYFSDIDNRIGLPVYFYQYTGKGAMWEAFERIGIAYDEDFPSEHTKHVWLPSQDQLQGLSNEPIVQLLWDFFIFLYADTEASIATKDKIVNYRLKFETIEQLLLAFTMKHNYKKCWNGSTWVEI